MSQSPSRIDVSSVNEFSNVIVDVTISCRSFVSSPSCAQVSAGFINVSGLAVQHLMLYTAPCLFSV